MKTVYIDLDDELDTALETICSEAGFSKVEILLNVVRKFVEAENLKKTLQDRELQELYKSLMNEDVMLAEEGIGEYTEMLREADHK